MPGSLILAATPIGNLGDVSHRLIETLSLADEVWCEDTRVTRKLINHFGIKVKLKAFHEYSEPSVHRQVHNILKASTLVYVSDAGMPSVSDPGFELVKLAREVGADIDVLPGPSAVLNALVLSGFSCHEFAFLGFFPEKLNARKRLADRLSVLAMTTIHFESPKRIRHTLEFLQDILPETNLAVCRELTKLHQQTLVGTAERLLEQLTVEKGEIVLVIEPVKDQIPQETPESFYQKLIMEGLHPRQAMKKTATTFSIKKRELYRIVNIET